MSRRILVVTVVHHPLDARIFHRQVKALLHQGWTVTYAAPWGGYDVERPTHNRNLAAIDLPRASGRHRLRALRHVRGVLGSEGPKHDVVLLHDPELIPVTFGLALPPVVWDVHEDTAAAIAVRPWVPRAVKRPAGAVVRAVEWWAERRMTLILADSAYQTRFSRRHAVVPNTTYVVAEPVPAGTPDEEGRRSVIYLGSVTMERGAAELVEVGRRVQEETGGKLLLHVLGPAHGPARELIARADAEGDVRWSGFLPNPDALKRLDGALAGLSLLHDEENFRPSMPTKVVEYLAHGVPVITTPLPLASDLVTRSGGGIAVPFRGVQEVTDQLLRWHADTDRAVEAGRRGHAEVHKRFNWEDQARAFTDLLDGLAGAHRRADPT